MNPISNQMLIAHMPEITDISKEGIKEISEIIEKLRLFSPQWRNLAVNALYRFSQDQQEDSLIARLRLERDFFQDLVKEGENYQIGSERLLFRYDDKTFQCLAFLHKNILLGCADFESYFDSIILEYVQGSGAMSTEKQRELFGKPWYEVFMERTIEAYKPLYEAGIKLFQEIPEPGATRVILPRMIRDRYFERDSVSDKVDRHPINLRKERVKAVLSPLMQ